jgi:hypothetical protein
MIHYHGMPITPDTCAINAINVGHAFVSYKSKGQLGVVIDVCQSFAVDNGAFSSWRSGNPVTDWSGYYDWVKEIYRIPNFDFAVIPDVIDGTEQDNDSLLLEFPYQIGKYLSVGAPVWHMHETLGRLERLAYGYPRVCIGSSGEFSTVGNDKWWARMSQAMDIVCNADGLPLCKLHGLRMLNPEIFSKLPLSSADSCNIAMNIGIDKKWKGTYLPPTKEARAMILRQRIESKNSASYWERLPTQGFLL